MERQSKRIKTNLQQGKNTHRHKMSLLSIGGDIFDSVFLESRSSAMITLNAKLC